MLITNSLNLLMPCMSILLMLELYYKNSYICCTFISHNLYSIYHTLISTKNHNELLKKQSNSLFFVVFFF